MELLTQNTKMKKSGDEFGYVVFNFGISAYKSITGELICKFADKCIKPCYAQQGTYTWSVVKNAYEARYQATKCLTFVYKMDKAIKKKAQNASKKDKKLAIRIHDSGDFYSVPYLLKWVQLAKKNPDVLFYAYTKALPFFKNIKLPPNFVVIFSEGGVCDNKIDTTNQRHARIFADETALEQAGYANAMENDLEAALSPNNKIGLVYHGAKSRAFKTGKAV